VIHQPVSLVLQCGAGAWLYELASGDQRRLMGSGVCDDTLYKSIVTVLYFTISLHLTVLLFWKM